MPQKTSKSKTTTNSNKNKNTQKVVVNINSNASTKKTSKKGTQSYTKGNAYLGGTSMRGVMYPSPTIINNIPSTPPMMFPTMETNRINNIENLAHNIASQVQELNGRIHASPNIEIKNVMPQLTQPMRDIVQQSRIMKDVEAQTTPKPHMSSQFSHVLPNAQPIDTGDTSSSTSTPSFGGSSSSSDGSSGGGNLPVQQDVSMITAQSASVASPMQSVQMGNSLSTIPEEPSIKQESSKPNTGNESVSSNSPQSRYDDITSALSRLSISRDTGVVGTPSNLPSIATTSKASKKSQKVKQENSSPPNSAGGAGSAKSSQGSNSPESVNQVSPSKKDLDDKFQFYKYKNQLDKAKSKNDADTISKEEQNIRELYFSKTGKGQKMKIDTIIKRMDKSFR
jgi:hypothetical protein